MHYLPLLQRKFLKHNKKGKTQNDIYDIFQKGRTCLLYTSDAADEEDSVDLGGRRIIKKKIFSSIRRQTR